jgi:hypothetical protein
MITTIIGKTLLAEYNRRMGKNLSSREFFESVQHPLFFDHPKYMQWPGNSPFVQGYKKTAPPSEVQRQEMLKTLTDKVAGEDFPDASFAIGFPAAGADGTTSGQVTNLSLPVSEEDVYASWIGGGLGIGVQGGFSFLFRNAEILWKVFEGWSFYRRFLNEYPQMRGNQIDTWNGQWFSYACSEDFDEISPETGMANAMSASKDGGLEINTQQWTEVAFGIAAKFPQKQLTGYVYSLGQMNTTIGFMPFRLPELLMPLQFYRELFGENEFLDNREKIRKMYGTAQRFRNACQKGAIGVSALEPKDLVQFMSNGRGKGKNPDFGKADEERNVSFNVYQTWLLAMLNNKELWEQANNAATVLVDFAAGAKKANRQRENAIDEVLGAPSKRKFIEASTALVETETQVAERLFSLVEQVNILPEDNFRYFQTLIKFRYAFLKSQQKGENQ